MTYSVQVKRDAEKELRKLPLHIQLKVAKVLTELTQDPRPRQCKRLKGTEHYRVRLGQYRIIYTVNDRLKNVSVTSIAHRKDVYRL